MYNKKFKFTRETKKFSNFSMSLIPLALISGSPSVAPLKELLTSNAGSTHLSKGLSSYPYSYRKSFLNCKFTLYKVPFFKKGDLCLPTLKGRKVNDNSYQGILIQLIPYASKCGLSPHLSLLSYYERREKVCRHKCLLNCPTGLKVNTLKSNIQVMTRWYFIQSVGSAHTYAFPIRDLKGTGNLVSLQKKASLGWYFELCAFYIKQKIYYYSMGSNIHIIKAIKKAFSQLYFIIIQPPNPHYYLWGLNAHSFSYPTPFFHNMNLLSCYERRHKGPKGKGHSLKVNPHFKEGISVLKVKKGRAHTFPFFHIMKEGLSVKNRSAVLYTLIKNQLCRTQLIFSNPPSLEGVNIITPYKEGGGYKAQVLRFRPMFHYHLEKVGWTRLLCPQNTPLFSYLRKVVENRDGQAQISLRKSFERNFHTLYGVPYSSFFSKNHPTGLEDPSGTPAQLKRQYKQNFKKTFTKILLFLKKETLKKSYQTPAVIITKLNQQLHSTSLQRMLGGRMNKGLKPLKVTFCHKRPFLLCKRVGGLDEQSISPLNYNLAERYFLKKETNYSDTFSLINKSIKKLIWTMLKKQYSNISLSLIANRNWFFLLVKNLTKINLLNKQEYNLPLFSYLRKGGKKSDSFQQMSYFFSLSLVPFKPVSIKKGKSSLFQINCSFLFWSKKNMVYKKIEPNFLSNGIFNPGFFSQVNTRDFNLLFKWILISPIQNSFSIIVKSGVRLNTLYLKCFLFLKINLYNNYTFLYTSQQLHKNKKETKNGISQNYLLGITHYLDSLKSQQSGLKLSQLFEQFSFIYDKLVISKIYYLGGILFMCLGNSQYSSLRDKKVIVQNNKQNYPISPFNNCFLFQVSYKRLKYKKKQKVLYIWKNQDQVTSFCHYSF